MSDHLFIAAGDLQISEAMLGRGYFGIVYPAVLVSTKKQVAVKKIMFDEKGWGKWYDQIKKEENLMRMVHHPHIVEYIGYNENEPSRQFWIVMELMDGTLQPYCNGQETMEDFCKYDVGVQCWSALFYLHDRVIIAHKDIKPGNILIKKLANDKILAKLSDFGLSDVKESIDKTTQTHGDGTIGYTAPEVYANKERNPQQADVYSMGVTLTELFAGQRFWPPGTMIEHTLATWYNLACASAGSEDTPAVDALPDHLVTATSSWPKRVKACLIAAIAIKRSSRPSAAAALKIFTATDSGYWELTLIMNTLTLCKSDANGKSVGTLTQENFVQWSVSEPDSGVCSFIAFHCGINEADIVRMATNFDMVRKSIAPYLKTFRIDCDEYCFLINDYVSFCPILEELHLKGSHIDTLFASLNTLSSTLIVIELDGEFSHENVLSFLSHWCPNLRTFDNSGWSILLNDTVLRKFCDSCTALDAIHLHVSGYTLGICESFWILPLTQLGLAIGENKTTDGSILQMITSSFKNLNTLYFVLDGMLSDYDVFPLRYLTHLQTLALYCKNLVRLSIGISSIVKAGHIKKLVLYNVDIRDECFSNCPKFFTLLELFETAFRELLPQTAVEMVQVLEKYQMLEKVQLYVEGSIRAFFEEGIRENYAKSIYDQIDIAAKKSSVLHFGYAYPSWKNVWILT